jgi:serpin B
MPAGGRCPSRLVLPRHRDPFQVHSMTRLPLLALICSYVALTCAPAQEQRPDPAENDARILATALDRFGAELAARMGKDGNLCLSPASVGLCLLMMLPGARGATADELHKLLCPDGWDDKRTLLAARTLMVHLHGSRTIEMSLVNDLWPQTGHPLVPEFLAATRAAFDSVVRPQDFRKDPMAARKIINDYVARATKQRITDLLPPDLVGPETRLVLTNAIYLKADWLGKFDGDETREGAFQLADGNQVQVPFMHRRGQYAIADVAGLQVLRMPYVDQEFAFEVALPAKGATLASAEAALRPEGIGAWAALLKAQAVDVTLPSFRVENRFRLVEALRALGLVKATTPDEADFSGIDGGAGNLFIGEAVHKTFLDVAEKGTEAAAATAVVMKSVSMPEPAVRFTADQPFAFALRDLRTGLVLFAGRVADPRGHRE